MNRLFVTTCIIFNFNFFQLSSKIRLQPTNIRYRLALLRKIFEASGNKKGQITNLEKIEKFNNLATYTSQCTPWRSKYTLNALNSRVDDNQNNFNKICPFCSQQKEGPDSKNYILARFNHCFVMLNLYPYNVGHVLIIPYRHVSSLDLLNQDEQHELIEVQSLCLQKLKSALRNQGFNIGMNVGHIAAGASIPDHLHVHIVPRWIGDTGFLSAVAQTQIVGVDLSDLYDHLKKVF